MHAIEGTGNVPAFLTKLWRLVDDPKTDDLICWTQNGRSFVIQNQAMFARELLPQYYKHNNMASFVRQLNMYGFHKVVSADSGGLRVEKDEMEFAHPAFHQGREELIENIKRKISTSRVGMEDNKKLGKLLNDVRDMKRDHDTMSTKLLGLKRENEALWREYANMRQKFAKQQQIIEKLIHFLIAMVKSPAKPIIPKRKFGHLALEGGDESNTSTGATLGSLPQLSQNIEMLDGLTSGTTGGAKIHEVTDLMDSDDPYDIPNIFTPESNQPDIRVEEVTTTPDTGGTDLNVANTIKEPDTILLVNGEPFVDTTPKTIPVPSTSGTFSTPITVTTSTVMNPNSHHSMTDTINSKIAAYNKLLDEAPLSPELLHTVDPSVVTQSFKYAATPSVTVTSTPTVKTTTGAKVVAGPSKVQIASKSSQIPMSKGKGKLKGMKVQKTTSPPPPPPQPSMSVAVPEKNFNKNELQSHMDDMQNSIDSLQEIISAGGFNMDTSVLLTQMFGSEDNLPDLDSIATSSGNELSLYNPSLLDLADITEDTEEDPMNFLNRSTSASTSSASGAMPPSVSNAASVLSTKSKSGPPGLTPLDISIKLENDDVLSTPKVMAPTSQSPVFRGKKRRN